MKQTWSSSTTEPTVWPGHGQVAPWETRLERLCVLRGKWGKDRNGAPSSCVGVCRWEMTQRAETVGLEIHNSQAQAAGLASLRREGCRGWDVVKGQLLLAPENHFAFKIYSQPLEGC